MAHARSAKWLAGRNGGPPKFSLAHLTVLGCAPPEAAYIAAAAGYDFVSLRIMFLGLPGEPDYALARKPEMLRKTKRALAETGLKVHDVELARIVDGIDVKTYEPALHTAAELGARYVIASIWTERRDYASETLAELCDLAKAAGLNVSLEFLTWTPLANLQRALEMCRGVQRDNCGLLIDTLHFNRSRVALEELDAVPVEMFHFAHVCDAGKEIPSASEDLVYTAREARLDPGQGGIDLAAILERLPNVAYSLEIPNLKRVKEVGYAEHARLCLENARKYFSVRTAASKIGDRGVGSGRFIPRG
jgi:sugar phosphate isomerase/epimerase